MQYTSSNSFYQHTLADSFHCLGRGLHSGLKVAMTVLPSDENSGYMFRRRDVNDGNSEVAARWYNVSETNLSTTITNNFGVRVSTIEHLMAALRGCGVDNAYITLDGPEVPILDGSAQQFVSLIRRAGVQKQSAERRALLLHKVIELRDEQASVRLVPAAQPSVEVEIDFDHPAIGRQKRKIDLMSHHFEDELASSRTFGFEADISALRKLGFARGGSLDNAVLLGENGVLNEGGLRHSDEFVRHKCLDAVGDLALLGPYIMAAYQGHRSGHRLNNLLLRALQSESVQNVSLREAMQWWQSKTARSAEQAEIRQRYRG